MSGPGDKQSHHNNIGVLRLLFALMVLLSHCFVIARGSNDTEPLYWLTSKQTTLGGLAVDCFFLLSGYLIVKSWQTSSSAAGFVRRRLVRVYPGYLAAMVFSALLASAHSSGGPVNYARMLFYRNDAVLRALLFVQSPQEILRIDTFKGNPLPMDVNGSLWTLQSELDCYVLVLVVGCLGLYRRPGLLAALFAAIWGIYAVNLFRLNPGPVSEPWSTLARLMVFFAAGAMFYLARDRIRLGSPMLLVPSVLLLIAGGWFSPWLQLVMPFAGGYLLFSVAYASRTVLSAFTARIDLSYGVYIFAFPIQQACAAHGATQNPALLFALSLPITLALAAASWFFIEKPCIQWGHSFGNETARKQTVAGDDHVARENAPARLNGSETPLQEGSSLR